MNNADLVAPPPMLYLSPFQGLHALHLSSHGGTLLLFPLLPASPGLGSGTISLTYDPLHVAGIGFHSASPRLLQQGLPGQSELKCSRRSRLDADTLRRTGMLASKRKLCRASNSSAASRCRSSSSKSLCSWATARRILPDCSASPCRVE